MAVLHPGPARLAALRMLVIALLGCVLASFAVVRDDAGRPAARVIVQAATAEDAAVAVVDAGGTVERPLSVIGGVAATVPRHRLGALGRDPRVRSVSPNAAVSFSGTPTNETTVKPVWIREMRADALHARGIDGTGTTIALIDTGVSPAAHPGLKTSERLVRPADDFGTIGECVDFSGEGTCEDSYGHGTFLAGLMVADPAPSGGRYGGIAPGAKILSIKIADEDGSSDVSKVIAAIDWAVIHRNEYDISVLNLSLGTDSDQSFDIDPLNRAVQHAWDAGITVVVAAGNRGPHFETISKPGDDPLVITVGAVDDRETPATDDDRVPRFTSRGPTRATAIGSTTGIPKPDVVAPGARVVSAVPAGSTLDQFSSAAVPKPYLRGSGSSMAAALVSGGVALLEQANPAWEPGHIKTALKTTTTKIGVKDPRIVGAGLVDLSAASKVVEPTDANALIEKRSDGRGSLDASRGSVRACVESGPDSTECEELRGETTAQGIPWDSDGYGSVTDLGTSWYGTSWYGTSWYGTSWYIYTTAPGSTGGDGSSESTTSYGEDAPASAFYGLYG